MNPVTAPIRSKSRRGTTIVETALILPIFLLFVMGLVYGPLGAWLPGLFPARVRYTGASICFNAAESSGSVFT